MPYKNSLIEAFSWCAAMGNINISPYSPIFSFLHPYHPCEAGSAKEALGIHDDRGNKLSLWLFAAHSKSFGCVFESIAFAFKFKQMTMMK